MLSRSTAAVLVVLVVLGACAVPLGGPNDPALVAQIGLPEVRAAWREPDGATVVVTDLAEPEAASELCLRVAVQLDIGGATVWYREGRRPWDGYVQLACMF